MPSFRVSVGLVQPPTADRNGVYRYIAGIHDRVHMRTDFEVSGARFFFFFLTTRETYYILFVSPTGTKTTVVPFKRT